MTQSLDLPEALTSSQMGHRLSNTLLTYATYMRATIAEQPLNDYRKKELHAYATYMRLSIADHRLSTHNFERLWTIDSRPLYDYRLTAPRAIIVRAMSWLLWACIWCRFLRRFILLNIRLIVHVRHGTSVGKLDRQFSV